MTTVATPPILPVDTFDPSEHLLKLPHKDKKNSKETVQQYLEVKWRIVWFVAEQRRLISSGQARQHYSMLVEIEEHDRTQHWANCRATVTDVLGNRAIMFGSESASDFPDYLEKAQTKALGRALALLGFGTQFTGGELDEGSRIVDAPVRTDFAL